VPQVAYLSAYESKGSRNSVLGQETPRVGQAITTRNRLTCAFLLSLGLLKDWGTLEKGTGHANGQGYDT
jgi:hypothetical protein